MRNGKNHNAIILNKFGVFLLVIFVCSSLTMCSTENVSSSSNYTEEYNSNQTAFLCKKSDRREYYILDYSNNSVCVIDYVRSTRSVDYGTFEQCEENNKLLKVTYSHKSRYSGEILENDHFWIYHNGDNYYYTNNPERLDNDYILPMKEVSVNEAKSYIN